jgi:hypothetical protein
MRTSTAMQRHDFDPIAFIFGLLFTGSGVLFMIDRFDLFNHARWLWPGLLVLLGIAVLVGARGRGSQARDRQLGAGPAVGAGPAQVAPDLDAIEPPIGPEAFRLPGWPAPGEPPGAAAGSSTDVMEPVEPMEPMEPVAPSGQEAREGAGAPEGADTPRSPAGGSAPR